MAVEDWLPWADRAYFGAAIIAAIATALTVVAGIAQNRINARISVNKDRAFNEFRVASETHVAELHKLTAEANQKAEEERRARLQLEAQIAPRRLTTEQQNRIALALAKFAGRRIGVVSYTLDVESAVLAKQIIACLQASHMDVADGAATVMPFGSFALGIHLSGPDFELTSAILLALQSIGGLAIIIDQGPGIAGYDQGSPAPAATVMIGPKPVAG